ncbi:MAG: hypothetical protein IAE65_04645 [Ignavibacteria bacterium]|nr:hypothetical protein [Ignavibacteria bacterium]
MELLQNEVKLYSSNSDIIDLTNLRVFMKYKSWGKSCYSSIFLEDVGYIESNYKNNFLFLIWGILAILFSVVLFYILKSESISILGFLLGSLLCILYLFSKQHLIVITSKSGNSIKFSVDAMKESSIIEFISNVEQAKLNRINQLYNI